MVGFPEKELYVIKQEKALFISGRKPAAVGA